MFTEPNDKAIKITGSQNIKGASGLTKREHFAAMAMQGLLANPNGAMQENNYRTESPDGLAKVALAHADALITALNK